MRKYLKVSILICLYFLFSNLALASYPVTVDSKIDTPEWTVDGSYATTAGDINGDGYSDSIVCGTIGLSGLSFGNHVFVYYGSPSGPGSTADWSVVLDYDVYSVASAGDVNGDGYSDVIFGGQYTGESYHSDSRISIFYGAQSGLSSTPGLLLEYKGTGMTKVDSVASAGDLNGDGYTDVIVRTFNVMEFYPESQVLVYYGSSSGPNANPDWSMTNPGGYPGIGVITTADVNNDGYADLVSGTSELNIMNNTTTNHVFVFYGSPSGLGSTADWSVVVNWDVGLLASAGDVNGDGYSDVIIGGVYTNDDHKSNAHIYAYYGSQSGPSITPSLSLEYEGTTDIYITSISSAGDANNDGYSDLIVGWGRGESFDPDDEVPSYGFATVYNGSTSGLSSTAYWTVESDESSWDHYYSVATAGDVNGDGYSDVIFADGSGNKIKLYHGPLPEGTTDYYYYDGDSDNNNDGGGDGCFIATAAYGSILEPHVVILREFRDRFLMKTSIGKAFVNFYYTHSSPIAKIIANHDALRFAVRCGLLPIVGFSWVMLILGPITSLALVILLGSGIVWITGFRRIK